MDNDARGRDTEGSPSSARNVTVMGIPNPQAFAHSFRS